MRVPRYALTPLNADLQPGIEAECIAYVVATAKVAGGARRLHECHRRSCIVASHGVQRHSTTDQIHALSRAIFGDRVRYLLADEVGFGKDHRGQKYIRVASKQSGVLSLPTPGDLIAQRSERIEVVLYGLDDELLKLTAKNR